MDINPFEVAGKTVRRTYEAAQDTYNYSQSALWNSMPGNPFPNISQSASDTIIDAAKNAVRHNDLEEAAHQMRREIYFCSIVDKLAGSKNEIAAREGLKAIKFGMHPKDIPYFMDHATDDERGFFSQEPTEMQRTINSIKAWYQKDSIGAAKYLQYLHEKIAKEVRASNPVMYADLVDLATINLAIADLKLDQKDPLAARPLYIEANESLRRARCPGVAAGSLGEAREQVKQKLRRMDPSWP